MLGLAPIWGGLRTERICVCACEFVSVCIDEIEKVSCLHHDLCYITLTHHYL